MVELEHLQPYLKIAMAVYLLMFLGNWTVKIRTTNRTKLMLYAGGWSGVVALTARLARPRHGAVIYQGRSLQRRIHRHLGLGRNRHSFSQIAAVLFHMENNRG